MSESFIIKHTAFDDASLLAVKETTSFIIGPGELNGPTGFARNTDLRFYGYGSAKWGEGINQNIYRVLENSACPQKETGDWYDDGVNTPGYDYVAGSDPRLPKDEKDLGTGNGITVPVNGQSWFNTTNEISYVYSSTTGLWTSGAEGGVIAGDLDMATNYIFNMGPPPDINDIAYNTYATNMAFTNENYLRRDGLNAMTGHLDMADSAGSPLIQNRIINLAAPVNGNDAVNYSTLTTSYLPLIGGGMAGNISFAIPLPSGGTVLSSGLQWTGNTDVANILVEAYGTESSRFLIEIKDNANTTDSIALRTWSAGSTNDSLEVFYHVMHIRTPLDMNTMPIYNLPVATGGNHALSRDAGDARYLQLGSGGTDDYVSKTTSTAQSITSALTINNGFTVNAGISNVIVNAATFSVTAANTAIQGTSTSTTGIVYGVKGTSASISGRGVYGIASHTTGIVYGVYGEALSSSGVAVWGEHTATGSEYGKGVVGISNSTNGSGVVGSSQATTGFTYGMSGSSSSINGTGVKGSVSQTTGTNYGVMGTSASSTGVGIYGEVTDTTASISFGVMGISNTTAGRGVYGECTGATSVIGYGVYGTTASQSGRGVYGQATSATGVVYGVYGLSESESGIGVYGKTTETSLISTGVMGYAESSNGRGVYGYAIAASGSTKGVYGLAQSITGKGVHGHTGHATGTTYAVFGEANSASGYDFYAGGSGTNYGPFTGAHDGLVIIETFNAIPGDIMVDGSIVAKHNISNTIAENEISTTENQNNVIGCLVSTPMPMVYDPVDEDNNLPVAIKNLEDWEISAIVNQYQRISINSLGEGQINVCGETGDIEIGDYIVSSNMQGKGMKQADNFYRNYTVAKSRENVTFTTPDEVKQIACIYLCG